MKVALFIDSLGTTPGGAERVVADLARVETERGLSVEVFHFGHAWLARQLESEGLVGRELPRHRDYKSIWRLPRFVSGFRRLLRRESFDLLHSHLLGACFAGSISARLAGIPSVSTLHDSYTLADSNALAFWTVRWSSALTAVADDIRDAVSERFPAATGKLRVVYNGVPPTPATDPAETRARLGIAKEATVFACVANLRAIKRHDLLIRGFSRAGLGSEAQLLIIGDGALRGGLEALARELDIQANTHFLGNRDDVPDLLAASDAFVLASDSEGLSRSIVEAMAQSLPVIACRVGGNSVLVADRENGRLVAPGDATALAEALRSLHTDPAEAQRMGRRSRERVRRQFELEATVSQYLEIYGELLGG